MINFWKKFATLIFLGLTILMMNLSICNARITLDTSLKPDNSPGVFISQDTLKQQGSEAYFGNYLLQVLAGALITVAAPVAIIVIAIAGLIAVVSHGDQALIGKAKKTVQWAVIGLLIIIFSWVIIRTTISIVFTTNSNQPATNSSTSGSPGSGAATPPKSTSSTGG